MKPLLPLLLVLVCRVLPAADELAAFRVAGHYLPPFASGVWFVTQGGDTPQVNHHQAAPEQMFGVDLVMTVARGLRRGMDDSLGDYHAYGQPVVAPCAGTVLEVEGARPDNAIGQSDVAMPFGNHVVIDAGGGEYVVLAHFRPGSLVVAAHDRVVAGQRLGLVGNSGNTTMPHIHMHIQDAPQPGRGHGRLFTFGGVTGTIAGTRLVEAEVPLLAGMWLER